MTIHEQIARLEQTILRLHQHIEEIEKEFNKLSASDLPKKMEAKEQELNHLQSKLLVCQQEKEAIQQALDEKVKELENSNLTKEEKATAIIKLTENNRNELNSVSQKLEEAWANYAQQQNKIIKYLTHSCSVCESKSETIQDLTKVRNWLIGVVSLLLLLLYHSWRPKKPKKNLKYDNLTRIFK